MKNYLISLGLLATTALPCLPAESLRTDINPALQYYQAFILTPVLAPADSDYLFTNNWQGQNVPERLGKLLTEYDNQFALVRQAGRATAPCDWGIDMRAGPATLLPHLARAKSVAVATKLRVPWHLQNGRQDAAREDLVGAFALARNVSHDETLIGLLVQIASEAIDCSTLAVNFGRFTPETLAQLAAVLEAAPARRTVAECMSTEKALFLKWTERKVLDLQQQHPGDDARVMEGIHELLGLEDPVEGGTNLWQVLVQASGGTSEGVLKLLGEREQAYDRTVEFVALPYAQFTRQVKAFSDDMANSPNPFIAATIPKFVKAREREFRILATLNIVRAAIAYKLHGEQGFRAVTDPCGNGPFSLRRFAFQGVDRGFEVKSGFDLGGNMAVLIFVEKQGAPFQVDGNYPGRPLPVVAGEK